MDYSLDNEMWGWQGKDYNTQEDADLDISKFLWNGVSQNEEEFSYMFDKTTPIKACRDFAYHVTESENLNKEPQSRETYSQVKRRRMLQFDTEALNNPFCHEEMSSTFSNSKVDYENALERVTEDSVEKALSDVSQWVSGFVEDASASSLEGLDQSSEGWLANCFNDAEMHFTPDDMNLSTASDVQVDVTEHCSTPPDSEANSVEELPVRIRRNIVFKGQKSYMRTPTKLAGSVVYPFTFIKPCGVHGDVTLKDINQRILTPQSLKSKQNKDDPLATYPTSAFSGKPVVGKTKIRTEGGKGSITIMRTKG